MNIALIGPAYPLRGGNALFVAHVYASLSKRHTVNVISYSRLYPGLLFPGERQHDISNTPMLPHPAEAIIDCLNPFTWWRAAARVRSLMPDLLVITWWNPFFGPLLRSIMLRVKRHTRIPIVVVAENVVSHEGRSVDLFLTRMALRYADRFLVLSQVVERDIRRLFPGTGIFRSTLPVYECYTPSQTLSPEAARSALGLERKKVILFFGYIRGYKGLRHLINAMPAVCAEITDAHLLIVGEFYDDRKPYDALIRDRGVSSNVMIVPEYVSNEDVHRYFEAANVVVLPYNEATQSGIVSIAAAFSRPVITTDVGGLPELVEDGVTGYVVPKEDPARLAAAIIRYFREQKEDEFSAQMQLARDKNDFQRILTVFDDLSRDLSGEAA